MAVDMENQDHTQTILKELSDIKASLAVNTNETANIKASVAEIKIDVREIKNDFVPKRELDDRLRTIITLSAIHETRLKWLERIAYGGMGIIAFIEFYFRVIKI